MKPQDHNPNQNLDQSALGHSPLGHTSDRDLLMAADGELDAKQTAAVRDHLTACWSCRARMRAIEESVASFVEAHQAAVEIPPAAGPRALLNARMEHIAATTRPSLRDRMAQFLSVGNRLAYVGSSFFAVAFALFSWGLYKDAQLIETLTPDPNLTPGAALPVSQNEICSGGLETPVRFIPASLGREVFERYGIGDPRPRAYELDYLIAPELGGSGDARNVWPQPYSAPGWNAHVKDALEEYLHQLVCEEKVSLATAQRDISTDWISAYKKYFETEEPMESHIAFTKDLPWE